jgi:type IV pilus assembly protein PilN
MLKVSLNLASKPFFNNRKYYAVSLLLGLVFVGLSAANLLLYLAHRSQSQRLNRELADQTAEAGRLEQQQQEIWARLQRPETEDFLNLVDYLNPLIARRTFSWTRFLNQLENLVPHQVQIVAITPRIVESEITVEIFCNARSGADYIEFISRLEADPDFYRVNLMTEDVSKSPSFVGKNYGLQVKYRAQPPREQAEAGGPLLDHSPGSVP